MNANEDVCNCDCHKDNYAGEEKFCIACDNDWANLCSNFEGQYTDFTEEEMQILAIPRSNNTANKWAQYDEDY